MESTLASLQVAGIEVTPAVVAPLDPGFLPAALFTRKYRALVQAKGGVPLRLGLERGDGSISTYSTTVLPASAGHEANPAARRAHCEVPALAARRMEVLCGRPGQHRTIYQRCLLANWQP